ncbi:unnamed protein product [Trichobilharzia szidati]|nr:unnamed protein product [Trichobilharzia szidati]
MKLEVFFSLICLLTIQSFIQSKPLGNSDEGGVWSFTPNRLSSGRMYQFVRVSPDHEKKYAKRGPEILWELD